MKIATQTNRYEYIRVVQKTNCTDKVYGHQYEWIAPSHLEYEAINAEYIKVKPLYGGHITRCVKCGKISNSM